MAAHHDNNNNYNIDYHRPCSLIEINSVAMTFVDDDDDDDDDDTIILMFS